MLTRRRALQVAAAAIAVPYVIPSSALGDASTPPPSERIGLGHIGVGGRGRAVWRGFMQCKSAQCVAAADPYTDRREACAAQMKGRAYRDFRELLDDKDVDAVVVATPDHWHVPIANEAARRRKHAYVEKPLGLSIEQDLACQRLFDREKLVFQYGTQQRSSKHCRFGCELVRSGRIGTVKAIEVVAPDGGTGGSLEAVAVPAGFDYDLWLGPAPAAPYTRDRCNPPGTYWINDYSIGYLAGWGAHPLDIMVWGSLADQAGPFTLEGTGIVPREGLYNTVIHWNVKGRFADGTTFSLLPGSDCTKFVGSEGWVEIRRRGIDAEPKSLLTATLGPTDTRLQESPRHDQNFLDAIRENRAAVSPIADAVRSDIISHVANIAVRTGRPITWDPKKAAIVDDEEAAAYVKRPMRQPWTL